MAFLFYKDIIKDMSVGFNNQLIENHIKGLLQQLTFLAICLQVICYFCFT